MKNLIFDITCYLILFFGIISRIINDSSTYSNETILVILFCFIIISLTLYYQIYQKYIIYEEWQDQLFFSHIRDILIGNPNKNNKKEWLEIFMQCVILILVGIISMVFYLYLYEFAYVIELQVSQLVYLCIYCILTIYSVGMQIFEILADVVGRVKSDFLNNKIFPNYIKLDGSADNEAKKLLFEGLSIGFPPKMLLSLLIFIIKIAYMLAAMIIIGTLVFLFSFIPKFSYSSVRIFFVILANICILLYEFGSIIGLNFYILFNIFFGGISLFGEAKEIKLIDIHKNYIELLEYWLNGNKIIDNFNKSNIPSMSVPSLLGNPENKLKIGKGMATEFFKYKFGNFFTPICVDILASLPLSFFDNKIAEVIIDNDLTKLSACYASVGGNSYSILGIVLSIACIIIYMHIVIYMYESYKNDILNIIDKSNKDDYSNINTKNILLIVYIIILIKIYVLSNILMNYMFESSLKLEGKKR